MKPSRPKDQRNADIVDRGQRIAALIDEPSVAAWLHNLEVQALERLIALSDNNTATPDQLRAASIRYSVIRDFRRDLRIAVTDAERIVKQLSEG